MVGLQGSSSITGALHAVNEAAILATGKGRCPTLVRPAFITGQAELPGAGIGF